jgi:hypothetical protein
LHTSSYSVNLVPHLLTNLVLKLLDIGRSTNINEELEEKKLEAKDEDRSLRKLKKLGSWRKLKKLGSWRKLTRLGSWEKAEETWKSEES